MICARKGTALRRESPSIEQCISSILDTRRQAEIVIIKSLEKEAYGEEIKCIQHKGKMAKVSMLLKLSPMIDPQGLLCVGGRLERGELTNEEKHVTTWQVTTRRTRGGAAQSKQWAVIFTCLTVRAIHIELIESMDTSSFINALRRFFAIRGPAIQLRSDNGTNFVGGSV
jgi:hypothetical protein